jgi:Arc/MetJ-type ribon-helix-helix transcriptional regulator
MTIHLPKDQQQFVHDAVRAGFYASEDDLFTDAVERLRQAMPKPARTSGKAAERRTKAAPQRKKPLSRDELNERLLASGLVTRLPDPAEDIDDDDDPPIVIQGEPLSETVIRERR